jgi:hypothetical protein
MGDKMVWHGSCSITVLLAFSASASLVHLARESLPVLTVNCIRLSVVVRRRIHKRDSWCRDPANLTARVDFATVPTKMIFGKPRPESSECFRTGQHCSQNDQETYKQNIAKTMHTLTLQHDSFGLENHLPLQHPVNGRKQQILGLAPWVAPP